ncbi:uncharacterized protein STEHIDRAFT_150725 [Stereum hirsutum FP-91666 SS1]|uniref:Uncharacterized protein n=1 Tax=Stereum hirsutum (strain FP-91666) TaxID=721885 RepID=R7RYY4_STEHR|nr:uncharacterized protein STEHIDRAFT_150725 [Stereum hirsutum FP-91666 SS1]EIM80125.1 hypothetical protein STEHIDRAFT_150725 [Stereum hirsutum FP-91666 SS1]
MPRPRFLRQPKSHDLHRNPKCMPRGLYHRHSSDQWAYCPQEQMDALLQKDMTSGPEAHRSAGREHGDV